MSEPTPRQQANLEATVRGFAAFSPDEPRRVLEFADEDVEVFASPDLANSGSFRGHEGYIKWTTQWFEAWDDFEIEVKSLEPVGERHVVIGVLQTAKGKGSGVPVEMDTAFMTEVEEGKFVALHLYTSRDEAIKVAEERETAG